MTEIEPAEVERHGRVSPSDMEPVEVERASTSSHSTSSTANEPRSAWATFKSMPLGERCVYALAALPMLPVLLLVGPIIAAAKCAEGDNSRYYQDPSPMDDDGDETPERRKEMLALRQAGYGDRVAVSLGNVPTGPVKDYSFRGRNALRKPAGIKSGSRPVKSANELWASHKDEPGKNSRDRTPNGSIRNSNGALGALGAGGFNNGGSPRSSNGGSREGSTRPRNISFNDAPSEVLRPEVVVHIGGSGGGEKSDANKDGASTSAPTNQTPHGSPFKAPGELSPARKMVSMLNGDDVWSGGSPTGSPRRSLDGVEEETERARGGSRFKPPRDSAMDDSNSAMDDSSHAPEGSDTPELPGVRERGDSANGSVMGDVEAEARQMLSVGGSKGASHGGDHSAEVNVLVKPFTETLHPSPKQVVPIVAVGDSSVAG